MRGGKNLEPFGFTNLPIYNLPLYYDINIESGENIKYKLIKCYKCLLSFSIQL